MGRLDVADERGVVSLFGHWFLIVENRFQPVLALHQKHQSLPND